MLKSIGARLTVRFGGSERYWRIRRLGRRLYFATAGRLFSARYATAEAFTDASALRYLLANTAIPVLLACGLIALLAIFAGQGNDLANDLGLGQLDTGAYDVLLQSVAAVTGVFLALYFAAVSAVAASVYARVPLLQCDAHAEGPAIAPPVGLRCLARGAPFAGSLTRYYRGY